MISSTQGAIKQFQNKALKFQQTFITPLDDLERFVATIVSTQGFIKKGCVTIDDIVFEPKTLQAFLTQHVSTAEIGHDVTIEALGQQEIEGLLRSTLADWIDFVFIPTPKPFMIYADHDEYITFYSDTQSDLDRLANSLSEKGFKKVENYERVF